MTPLQSVIEIVRQLEFDELLELQTVIEEELSKPTEAKAIIFNLHPGAMEMRADFDEPLPDDFWFGDDEVSP